MKAAVKFAHGAKNMSGMRIALQGLGSVSYYLLEHLVADGAKVIACDIDQTAIDRATKKYGIEIVSPDKIYDIPCEIFSPSALGATVNAQTLPRIHKTGAKIIAGAANNQLATADDGHQVQKLGMIYCPDYAINAGGVINIYYEGGAAGAGGYSKSKAFEHVSGIEKTIAEILIVRAYQKLPTHVIADRIAEERIEKARQAQNSRPIMSTRFRNADPLGLERVVSPRGVLPQQAEKLDPTLPLAEDEFESKSKV